MEDDGAPNVPDPFDPEARPRGILTKKDRGFLSSPEEELTSSQRSDKRYRIRERVKDAIRDFVYLDFFLSEEDRVKTFRDLQESGTLRMYISSLLIFLWAGFEEIEVDFEDVLKQSIEKHESRINPEEIARIEVNIDVDYEEPSIDDVTQRFFTGEATIADVNYLMANRESGAIDDIVQRFENLDESEREQMADRRPIHILRAISESITDLGESE